MRIRCERCATTYELDEKKLPPHGGMVKCTRCQHVFRAAPPVPGSPVPATPAREPAAGAQAAAPGLQAHPPGGNGVDPSAPERTAVFGYAGGGDPEGTASLGSAASTTDPAAGNSPGGVAKGTTTSPGARRWVWLVVGVAVAVAAGLLALR